MRYSQSAAVFLRLWPEHKYWRRLMLSYMQP